MRSDAWERLRRGREVPDFWHAGGPMDSPAWLWRMEGSTFRVIVAGNYLPVLSHADYILVHQRYRFLFQELRNELRLEEARILDFVLDTTNDDYVELKFSKIYSIEESFDLPASAVQAWNIEGMLFVSTSLKDLMEALGDHGLEFHPGFSWIG